MSSPEEKGDSIVAHAQGTGIAIGRGASASVSINPSPADLEPLFAGLLDVARSAPEPARTEATATAEALKDEAAKGADADDEKLATLVEKLVGLVPGAVSAVASAFGSPLLAGLAGPVTSFVLKKLGAK